MKAWMKALCEAPTLGYLKGYGAPRYICDEAGRSCIEVLSTTNNNRQNPIVGVISPVQADILGKVLAEYVASEQFKADWARIAEDHLK
jgi:hypothetical protein